MLCSLEKVLTRHLLRCSCSVGSRRQTNCTAKLQSVNTCSRLNENQGAAVFRPRLKFPWEKSLCKDAWGDRCFKICEILFWLGARTQKNKNGFLPVSCTITLCFSFMTDAALWQSIPVWHPHVYLQAEHFGPPFIVLMVGAERTPNLPLWHGPDSRL